ncbi:M12 family metallo-peptidase [Neolewinella lacunae]|uniref:T9SS type A sorting domain-containing protein n=1 Tax=Neolewinella lacunae TaxID=1517758 RepID=A0A923PND8_9BACT|nr:M12 family metallo-peptidase [Neolewinella lacunae]MBC6994428.1 T9SS type A sorting domain-containing protein [Neolewinella lacunae]MDN3633364.1 M12 family metallo-peptidase [Neolewinella lacunae]
MSTLSLTAQIRSAHTALPPGELFRALTNKSAPAELLAELNDFALFTADAETYASFRDAAPQSWTLDLPGSQLYPAGLTLRLERNDFLRHDFRLRSASTGVEIPRANLGAHYRGEVLGQPGSQVSLSLLDDELRATLNLPGGERLALGKVQGQQKSAPVATYVLFPDRQLLQRQELDCATADTGLPYTGKELAPPGAEKSAGGCVDIFFEVDYDIFFDKGSVMATAQHVAANFNEVSILYGQIGVNLRISEMLVWDRISPYAGSTSSAMLTQFQSIRTSFNGDLAQLLSYQASGGIAVLNGLCHPLNAAKLSFSSIRSNFAAVPVYSWSTMVIAHELGHLMGSQHTHACAWNGNGTAIDGCPGFTEGTCGTPSYPANGGTIMSYCHLSPAGINFLNGFGPQPSAVIANRVAAAQGCVQATCNTPPPPPPPGGGTGGDDDEEEEDPPYIKTCPAQTVFVNLTLDDFGMETTWRIRSEAGQVVASGGPYPKKQKGRVVRDTVCVPNGCYLFEIKDSDFDGICCDYGNGRFELIDSSGTILGRGSDFDTLQIVDFCLPDLPPAGEDCLEIDFIQQPVTSYGTNQDAGTQSILDQGRTLFIQRNAWKRVNLSYTITPSTVLSFWFRSTKEAEVNGIGFDDNDVISSNLTFRLYGTQNWGIGNYDNYPGNGQWKYYEIPVGQFYIGEAVYLFFTADHDVGTRDGNSYFRDVQISEGPPCRTASLPENLAEPDAQESLQLLPNPASSRVQVLLPAGKEVRSYQVIDLTGRTVLSGETGTDRLEFSVASLPPGTYVFRYDDGTGGDSQRFTVVR